MTGAHVKEQIQCIEQRVIGGTIFSACIPKTNTQCSASNYIAIGLTEIKTKLSKSNFLPPASLTK